MKCLPASSFARELCLPLNIAYWQRKSHQFSRCRAEIYNLWCATVIPKNTWHTYLEKCVRMFEQRRTQGGEDSPADIKADNPAIGAPVGFIGGTALLLLQSV